MQKPVKQSAKLLGRGLFVELAMAYLSCPFSQVLVNNSVRTKNHIKGTNCPEQFFSLIQKVFQNISGENVCHFS